MSAGSEAQPNAQTQAANTVGGRSRSNITVVIPAFNEELNIGHALKSVASWADRVFVVDSESTDRTREIAAEHGATVVVQPWLGYARQKNWALANLPIETDWVFILDADESITPELRDELVRLATQPAGYVPEAGFYVNRLTFFLGAPIRHCGFYPSYNLRFFRRGKARYEEREVHEHMIVDGPTARLNNLMLHEDRRGLEHLIAKHNRYSTLEAREVLRAESRRDSADLPQLERGIATRRWLKRNVLPKLPLTGFWRFIYMYLIRLGFLDGVAGLRFCAMLSIYDTMISLKIAELRSLGITAQTLPAPVPPSPQVSAGTVGKAKAAVEGGLALPEGTVAPVTPSFVSSVGSAAGTTAASAVAAVAAVGAAPVSGSGGGVVVGGVEMPNSSNNQRPGVTPSVSSQVPVPDPRHPDADRMAAELNPTRMPAGDFPAVKSVPVSILVPVKNEQKNIEECLRRCQWATELVVVDSKSTDTTIALSQAMGADVYQFNYDRSTGWPKKKNWALASVPWKNEWVMILDADEYMTPELAREIEQVVRGTWKPSGGYSQEGCGDGYWVNRRFMFMGRWLKGCGFYPSWNVRLLKHQRGRYERIGTLGDTGSGDNEVHEHIVLDTGKAGYLKFEFLHYAYPDLTAWVEKHNRYTSWEAHAMEAKDEGSVRAKFFGEPIERRRWIKSFARNLPFRPTLRFIYSYFFQRGFLDGYPGFVMCRLMAWYEFTSIAKFRERQIAKLESTQREMTRTSGQSLS